MGTAPITVHKDSSQYCASFGKVAFGGGILELQSLNGNSLALSLGAVSRMHSTMRWPNRLKLPTYIEGDQFTWMLPPVAADRLGPQRSEPVRAKPTQYEDPVHASATMIQ